MKEPDPSHRTARAALEGRHIRRFMRRRRDAAVSECKLICGTHNLLKLYRRALGDAGAAPYSRMATAANC